jgi:hypothetical protein
MTPKEKAEELVKKYENYVCGYIGSSMLTNTEYPEQILRQAKECAKIAVDEIMSLMIKFHNRHIEDNSNEIYFWEEVKNELNKQDK